MEGNVEVTRVDIATAMSLVAGSGEELALAPDIITNIAVISGGDTE